MYSQSQHDLTSGKVPSLLIWILCYLEWSHFTVKHLGLLSRGAKQTSEVFFCQHLPTPALGERELSWCYPTILPTVIMKGCLISSLLRIFLFLRSSLKNTIPHTYPEKLMFSQCLYADLVIRFDDRGRSSERDDQLCTNKPRWCREHWRQATTSHSPPVTAPAWWHILG